MSGKKTLICFRCGARYAKHVDYCPTCGIRLAEISQKLIENRCISKPALLLQHTKNSAGRLIEYLASQDVDEPFQDQFLEIQLSRGAWIYRDQVTSETTARNSVPGQSITIVTENLALKCVVEQTLIFKPLFVGSIEDEKDESSSDEENNLDNTIGWTESIFLKLITIFHTGRRDKLNAVKYGLFIENGTWTVVNPGGKPELPDDFSDEDLRLILSNLPSTEQSLEDPPSPEDEAIDRYSHAISISEKALHETAQGTIEIPYTQFSRMPSESGNLMSFRALADPTRYFEKGDYLSVGDERRFGRWGIVTDVKPDSITVRFSRDFDVASIPSAGTVSEALTLYPLRIQKNALRSARTREIVAPDLKEMIFGKNPPPKPKEVEIKFKDRDLENNPSQSRAVRLGIGTRSFFLIHGPPGTGKTSVISEITSQLVGRGKKVLIASQSNLAVDNALEKLMPSEEIKAVRIGRREKTSEQIMDILISKKAEELGNDVILHCRKRLKELKENLQRRHLGSRSNRLERQEMEARFLEDWTECISHEPLVLHPVVVAKADVVGTTCIGAGMEMLKECSFDFAIVDETSQSTVSETLVPITKASRFILVGDPNQLPPYAEESFLSELERRGVEKELVSKSVFEALFAKFGSDFAVMLDTQYRMHPDIASLVSEIWYDSRLKSDDSTTKHRLNLPMFPHPFLVYDTSYARGNLQRWENPSYSNELEAKTAVNVALTLVRGGVIPSQIAIIAPYRAQVFLIKRLLAGFESAAMVDVDTVDAFQGREKEVVIFSATRSRTGKFGKIGVGFLSDTRRLNVAFSRARKLLVIICNLKMFRGVANEEIRKIFQKIEEHAKKKEGFVHRVDDNVEP